MHDPVIVGRGPIPAHLGVRLTGLWEAKRRGAAVVPSFAFRHDPTDPQTMTLASFPADAYIRCRSIDPSITAPSAPSTGVRSTVVPNGDGAVSNGLQYVVDGDHPVDVVLTLSGHLAISKGWCGVAARRSGQPDAFVCTGGTTTITTAHDLKGILWVPQDQRRRRIGRSTLPPWLWGVRALLGHAHAVIQDGWYGTLDDTTTWIEWVHQGRKTKLVDLWPTGSLSDDVLLAGQT